MSKTDFYAPLLLEKGAWLDWRGIYSGGYGWRGDRPLTSISKIVIHHTVTEPSKNAKTDVDLIEKIHVNGNGWGGIGYHFLITSEEVNGYAKVAYVGDIGSIRAHAPDSKGTFCPKGTGNYYFLGISIVGKLHEVAPTEAQKRSLNELCKELIYEEDTRLPLIRTWADVVGHWDVDPTACPGNKWDYTQIKNFTIKTIPVIEDPIMIAEQQKQIEEMQSQLQAKDNVIQDIQKKLAFEQAESNELRTKSSTEFMSYKNEADTKYQTLKQSYDKLAAQMSDIDGNEQIVIENGQLKEQNASFRIQVEKLEGQVSELKLAIKNSTIDTTPVISETPVVETGKTVEELIVKEKSITKLLEFVKTHSTLFAKGSAYGSLALLIADIAVNILNMDVPQDMTLPSIAAFISSGVAISYGVWLRNKSIFERKLEIQEAVKEEVKSNE